MEISELIVLIFGESALDAVGNILLYITTAIGAATLIVEAFEKIAKITPSTKDDQLASKAKKYLGVVASVLDKLAMSKRDK